MRRYSKDSVVWRAIILVAYLGSFTASACLFLMKFCIHWDNSFLYFSPGGAATRFCVMASPYGVLQSQSLGTSPLDEWSARRRDPLPDKTQHYKETTFIPPAGFEPIIPACEWPQTHTLVRAATGIGRLPVLLIIVLFLPLTLRRLMSYIYGAPILDVSRSHTTTQHSR